MVISYNPYGWKIRKSTKTIEELIIIKEKERDELIEELQNYDSNVHHYSVTKMVEDLYEIQEEINGMWNDLMKNEGKGDVRPFFEIMEYYSD